MESENNLVSKKNTKITKFIFLLLLVAFMVVLSQSSLKEDKIIHISQNQTSEEVLDIFAQNKIVFSSQLLDLFLRVFDVKIKTGDYLFEKGTSFAEVVYQLAYKNLKISPIKITLREGLNNQEMAAIISQKLPEFNKEIFLNKTEELQGKLFPDTYFFFPKTTEDEIIYALKNNFDNKIKKINDKIIASQKDLKEIIVMASILEGEAKGVKDNRVISGILWKRLEIGMPLQVDVDKSTYSQKGLPKNPINNPGLDSLEAAINPEKTDYLYYLHDKNGDVYYAKSYEEHRKNINLYLK